MTAIAAICWQGEIVLAADSRRLNLATGEQTLACKIRDLTTLFAAVSGIDRYDPTHYDLYELLPAEMPEVDIATNVDSIENLLLPPLRLALEHLRSNNSESFQTYAIQKTPLDIKFACVQNGFPTIINLKVVVVNHGDGPVVITPERYYWPVLGISAVPRSFFIGTPEGVANYESLANSANLPFYQGGLVERARGFVKRKSRNRRVLSASVCACASALGLLGHDGMFSSQRSGRALFSM
jgi:hypothetical protein